VPGAAVLTNREVADGRTDGSPWRRAARKADRVVVIGKS
jgi:hypothetical protein